MRVWKEKKTGYRPSRSVSSPSDLSGSTTGQRCLLLSEGEGRIFLGVSYLLLRGLWATSIEHNRQNVCVWQIRRRWKGSGRLEQSFLEPSGGECPGRDATWYFYALLNVFYERTGRYRTSFVDEARFGAKRYMYNTQSYLKTAKAIRESSSLKFPHECTESSTV